MFTIKWISSEDDQMLYKGRDVSFTPALKRSEPSERPCVSFYTDDGVHCTIDSGRVYVMNDAGRTVADYIIATKEYPHGLSP